LDDKGNAAAKINTNYAGLQYENVHWQFMKNDKEKKETLYKQLDVPNTTITNFEYSQNKDVIPVATEQLNVTIRNYGSVSGKRMFVPAKIKNRKTEVVLDMPYMDSDTIVYEFPNTFTIEHLPKSTTLESDFGTYSTSITQEENKVTYIRTMKMYKKTFPPERYSELIDFYKKIIKADKVKMVIVKEIRP